ncbi:hypothetical protein GCM10009853_028790 [Glycomyces scopariae]|uniref:MORN repeat variant n=1 Tax=Glycomyces sambucus TaxID=380244 RepID=A0A1G9FSF8_9ACTN|nr:hypothetical protein [Glycomyces sambucus]SDK91349.1 hypothetical protein SAMN05216298_2002 [Glycomyces sambucus]
MKPNYDPVALSVPDDEIGIDDHQVYWHGSEKFTGFTGEELDSGNYEYQSFKDGWLDGPSGEVTPDGDLVVEEWYRKNFLYGITRRYRADGTLATAVGYEFGYAVWTVRFDLDGATVLATEYTSFNESQLKTLSGFRTRVPMPPLPGPEYAADPNRH